MAPQLAQMAPLKVPDFEPPRRCRNVFEQPLAAAAQEFAAALVGGQIARVAYLDSSCQVRGSRR